MFDDLKLHLDRAEAETRAILGKMADAGAGAETVLLLNAATEQLTALRHLIKSMAMSEQRRIYRVLEDAADAEDRAADPHQLPRFP